MPGSDQDLQDLVRYTEQLVQEYGEELIQKFRGLLLDQWDYILTMRVAMVLVALNLLLAGIL